MRIVFLQDDFPPTSFGGAGISTFELAQAVQRAGHEVAVISTCKASADAGESEYEGLHVFRIQSDYHEGWRAWRGLYNPPVVRQIEKFLKELAPDIVHVNNVHFHLSYHSIAIAKRYAKVVVWTGRDAMSFSYGKLATQKYFKAFDAHLSWRDHVRQAGKRYNPLRNFFIRKYLALADARFAVSDALRRALSQNGIEHVEVLHTGMPLPEWEADPGKVAAFKKRHEIEGKKIVLFGGRLGAADQVVRAMRLVAEKDQDAVLVIMGREESAARIKGASQDLPVIFTGWISGEDKVTAYAASDVVWVPSTYFDAFPRSALEASVSGKPVIAAKYGGVVELIENGKTGYVINPFDEKEIADATLDLLAHPEKARAFGAAGRSRVEAEFDIEEKTAELIARYESLLRKNG